MADFLSDAWFDAINLRLERHDPATGAILARSAQKSAANPQKSSTHLPVTVAIEMRIDANNPSSPMNGPVRSWHIRIDERGARLAPGHPNDGHATLTIYTDHNTGEALAANLTNAQRAIDGGTLRVRGDLNALATMTAVFGELSTLPHDH